MTISQIKADLDAYAATRDAREADYARELSEARAEVDRLTRALADCQNPTPPEPVKMTRIGMSAPKRLWDQRVAEVGIEGISARRLFVGPGEGMSIRAIRAEVDWCVERGITPMLSFKDDPTSANVAALRGELDALGVEVYATYWHEPRGDMPVATFRAKSETFLGVKSDRVRVGPILNGFLLNRAATMAEWEEFSNARLLAEWDFFGADLYQKLGGDVVPGTQIPTLVKWLGDKGYPDMDIAVGEYNSFEATSIAEAGETFLAVPNVKIACVWNSTGKPGSQEHIPLEGDRITAYQATKSDPRAVQV